MDGPNVNVLAVSKERCAFHVDRMWTSTTGPTHVDAWCGRHK